MPGHTRPAHPQSELGGRSSNVDGVSQRGSSGCRLGHLPTDFVQVQVVMPTSRLVRILKPGRCLTHNVTVLTVSRLEVPCLPQGGLSQLDLDDLPVPGIRISGREYVAST